MKTLKNELNWKSFASPGGDGYYTLQTEDTGDVPVRDLEVQQRWFQQALGPAKNEFSRNKELEGLVASAIIASSKSTLKARLLFASNGHVTN